MPGPSATPGRAAAGQAVQTRIDVRCRRSPQHCGSVAAVLGRAGQGRLVQVNQSCPAVAARTGCPGLRRAARSAMIPLGANLKHMLARTATLAVLLKGLLVELHRLDYSAADRGRRFALDAAADLKGHGATRAQVGGDRLEADILAYFGAFQLSPEA